MSAYETKRRNLDFFSGTGVTTLDYYGSGVTKSNQNCVITGRQTTSSRDNPDWALLRLIRKNGWGNDAIRMTDIGGTFTSTSNRYHHSHPWVIIPPVNAPGAMRSYKGPQFAKGSVVGAGHALWPVPPTIQFLQLEMDSKGATAISRCSPTNPSSGVVQALAELKADLPKVPGRTLARSQRRRSSSSRMGDEWLNYEFGILPTVSDANKIVHSVKESGKILKQFERDSGRLIRRRYEFPEEVTVTDPVVQGTNVAPSPPLDSYLYSVSSGVLTKQTTTVRRFWFSGAFTYYYAHGDDLKDRLRRAEQSANRLYGTRITPELLWELTPWSWAVDWVTNLGDVISNVSMFANDGLVMRHGYIMANITVTDTYTLSGIAYKGGPTQNLTQSFTTEVKARRAATPFGFGLRFDDFTTRQWAILAALGMNRGRGAQL